VNRFGPLLPPGGVRSIVDPNPASPADPTERGRGPSFDDILAGRLGAGGRVTLSAHTREVMAAEGIELGPVDLDRIGRAMETLAEAGSRDGLLVGEKGAFVVSVPDRTVVSMTPPGATKDTVFTRIDGAVLLD